jgi:hypothetical protein
MLQYVAAYTISIIVEIFFVIRNHVVSGQFMLIDPAVHDGQGDCFSSTHTHTPLP